MNLDNLNVTKLNEQEELTTIGGDGFAEDVGWLVGTMLEFGVKGTLGLADDAALILWSHS